MASPVIQFKRGAFANLPALQAGEPALTTDTHELYVGLNSTSAGNKFFGSHRYWTREAGTTGSGVNLVEGTDNGTHYVTIKSPDSLAGFVTFTMPGTDGSNGNVLVTDGSGNLSFSSPAASSFTIAADSGSNDTFNTGETLTFTGGEGIDTSVSDNTITIAAEDATETNKGIASFDGTDFTVTSGDVTVNAERIQDIAGAMFGSNTETLITATYQDSDGTIDLVVDNDLANYDNSTSAFITASGSATLTNKTFDANGTGNSLSNVEVADFAAAAIVLESEGIGSNDNDTSIPTSAAVKDYVDTNLTAQDLDVAGDSGTGAVDLDSQSLTVAGTANEIVTSASGQTITVALPDNVIVGNGLTATNATFTSLTLGSTAVTSTAAELNILDGVTATASELNILDGVTATAAELNVLDGVTAFVDEDNMASNSATSIPSQQSVKAYVDSQVGAVDVEFGTAGDSGTGTVNTSQSLTIAGTSNEVETSASGQTVTIGLPSAVTVTTSVTTPTVKATNVQANDGTTAITITNSTGAVAMNNNLTIAGNLIVNGSTTQVNTSQTTIEDQLLELGMVDGSAPSSDLNKDIGVIFNYYTSSAKKAAVYWDDSTSRVVVSQDVSESSGVLTNNTGGALEVASLYVNGCEASAVEVIGCDSGTITLSNVTIDGGTF